ncbi:MAG: endonuclease/exonuclease/phosphatase family protein [Gemmatimonadota bacterium]
MHRQGIAALTAAAFAVTLSGCTTGHGMIVGAPAGRCATTPEAQLAWARPEAEGEQSRLDRWCAATGGPVVRHAFVPDEIPGEVTPVDSLVVVLWNVEVGSGSLVQLLADQLDVSCSADAGSDGGRLPFVALIQEAYRASYDIPEIPEGVALPSRLGRSVSPEERTDIVEIARDCNLSLFYAPSMRNGTETEDEIPEDRGNAILSSVPLTGFAAIELPLETQRRVAVAALAHPPGRDPIRVVSFHFDVAANLLRVLISGNSTRLQQGLGLVQAIDEIDAGESRPVAVLGGDANSWSEKETVVRHLRELYPESPVPTSEGTRGSYPTDHMFVRASDGSNVSVVDGSYRIIPDTYGSDHRGRMLTLRFAGD